MCVWNEPLKVSFRVNVQWRHLSGLDVSRNTLTCREFIWLEEGSSNGNICLESRNGVYQSLCSFDCVYVCMYVNVCVCVWGMGGHKETISVNPGIRGRGQLHCGSDSWSSIEDESFCVTKPSAQFIRDTRTETETSRIQARTPCGQRASAGAGSVSRKAAPRLPEEDCPLLAAGGWINILNGGISL